MQISIGNAQDSGARERQEDYLASNSSNGVTVAVLTDGMGGYDGGDQASQIVAKAFLDFVTTQWTVYIKNNNSIPDLLVDGAYHANSKLLEFKEDTESNMGSTLVAIVINGDHAWWISIGDSLLYLSRGAHLQKINAEHSYYQELRQKVFLGELSSEDAINNPEREGLTSALMGREMKYVDVSQFGIDLQNNDILLLASDGLDTISQNQIATVLKRAKDPQQVSDSLVEEVIRVRNPHQDNVSVLTVKAKCDTKNTKSVSNINKKLWLMTLIPFVVGMGLGLVSSTFFYTPKKEPVSIPVNTLANTQIPAEQLVPRVPTKPKVDCDLEHKRTMQACERIADILPKKVKVKQYCGQIGTKSLELCNQYNNVQPQKIAIPQGVPAQGVPAQGVPAQGVPAQGVPAQGVPAQGVPAQGVPAQGVPAQGVPAQGVPAQGVPAQGVPAQGVPAQGVPAQGVPAQGTPPLQSIQQKK